VVWHLTPKQGLVWFLTESFTKSSYNKTRRLRPVTPAGLRQISKQTHSRQKHSLICGTSHLKCAQFSSAWTDLRWILNTVCSRELYVQILYNFILFILFTVANQNTQYWNKQNAFLLCLDVLYYNIRVCRLMQHVSTPPGIFITVSCNSKNC
jgi:hypothetical protein